MIFAEPHLEDHSELRTSEERKNVLNRILDSFRFAFPELHFELIGESKTINAQAVVLTGRREVRMYGGLAFHPLAGESAIVFTLLHEAGHHLASGCRLPWDPRLACECVADHWAATEGTRALAASGRGHFSLEAAICELNLILAPYHRSIETPACGNGRTIKNDRCWALDWASRRQNLIARQPVQVTACPIADLVLENSEMTGG